MAGHFAEHAEDVEDGFVDAVAGEGTEAGEVGLIFEFERPGKRAFEVHAILGGEIEFARENRGGVTGIHCAVAISEGRALAGGATFGIGFADDDGFGF